MRLLSTLLRRLIQTGTLRVFDASGELHEFGNGEAPRVTARIRDPKLYTQLFLNPELGAGEGYMDEKLVFEDGSELYDFVQLYNINRLNMTDHPVQAFVRRFSRLTRPLQQLNPVGRAQQNVAHHYDLSKDLYAAFLDEDLQYSCGYFLRPDDTLEEAQANKRRRITAKLLLEDGQRVLDIGCGYGGLALEIAQRKKVEVVGVTLSKEQHAVATDRAKAAGLSDRVRFELRDYRDLPGTFDRIVSVGMFEHVGVRRYREFFSYIYRSLEPRGLALLHSIGHMSPPGTAGAFMRKYIFPGAYSPALSEVFTATELESLWVSDVEVWRVHYADTIREWRKRFDANRAEIERLYDARFARMWEFYLVGAELMFRNGSQMAFQMQLARERDAAPLSRDYIGEAERAYRATDLSRAPAD